MHREFPSSMTFPKTVRVWRHIGRMLFQLMVPHEFKDAARQLERVVLVVDAATANLPWELMLADAPGASDDDDRLPMAVRMPVVRQLESLRFRAQVRQALARNALVVGNPSVEGFGAAFPDPRRPDATDNPDPPPLPGAEAEANAVAAVLGGLNYAVASAIGADYPASSVLALLYHQPYRFCTCRRTACSTCCTATASAAAASCSPAAC